MKRIIFLLALIPFSVFGKTVGFWYTKSDTLTQGDQSYIAIKYDLVNFSATDTLIISIANNPYIVGESSDKIICKMNIHDIDTITKHADGTTWIPFTIDPNFHTGTVDISIQWCSTSPSIYVKSSTISGLFYGSYDTKKTETKYYNMQGEEIQKPSEGFYLWRRSDGLSGKEFIL